MVQIPGCTITVITAGIVATHLLVYPVVTDLCMQVLAVVAEAVMARETVVTAADLAAVTETV